MPDVRACELPRDALLREYVIAGDYVDCFTTEVPRNVTHAEFVAAFYNTRLFKLERLILALVGKPSTDVEARELAEGSRADFAAWTVERRAVNQLLLCDFQGKTRSWLMVAPDGGTTRLYFGSAVVKPRGTSGEKRMPGGFNALLGCHKRYSHALLTAAHRALV